MKYQNFQEFYPFYLSQHTNINCLRMHFAGCVLAILFALYFIFTFHLGALIAIPLFGYGLAWLGHYLFEKNQPTSFENFLFSLMAGWVLFKDMVTRKINIF